MGAAQQHVACPACSQPIPLAFRPAKGTFIHCPRCGNDFDATPPARVGLWMFAASIGSFAVVMIVAMVVLLARLSSTDEELASDENPAPEVSATQPDSVAPAPSTDQTGAATSQANSVPPSPPTGTSSAPPAAEPPKAELRYDWQPKRSYNYIVAVRTTEDRETSERVGVVSYEALDDASEWATAGETSYGTGFVVGRDGYLVTTFAVVFGASRIDVQLNRRTYEAEVIAIDRNRNLAVLRVPESNLSALPLGEAAEGRIAQDVRVLGAAGDIAAEDCTIAGFVDRDDQKLFFLDAQVPGSYDGGPVIADGKVIGMMSQNDYSDELGSLTLAAPIDAAKQLLTEHEIKFETATGAAAGDLTAAVARIVATPGANGVGMSRQFALQCRTYFRPQFGARQELSHYQIQSLTKESDSKAGRLLVDEYGQPLDAVETEILPALLGSLDQLLILPMPEEAEQEHWQTLNLRPITYVIAEQSFSMPPQLLHLRPAADRHRYIRDIKVSAELIPALETGDFSVTERGGNMLRIKGEKHLLPLGEKKPFELRVEIEATFNAELSVMNRVVVRAEMTSGDDSDEKQEVNVIAQLVEGDEGQTPDFVEQFIDLDGAVVLTHSTSDIVRQDALTQLSRMQPKRYASSFVSSALVRMITTGYHQPTQLGSLVALGKWGNASHVPLLVEYAQRPSAVHATAAIRGLGQIQRPEAVEAMIALMRKDDAMRTTVTTALGYLGSNGEYCLWALADNPDPLIFRPALEVLSNHRNSESVLQALEARLTAGVEMEERRFAIKRALHVLKPGGGGVAGADVSETAAALKEFDELRRNETLLDARLAALKKAHDFHSSGILDGLAKIPRIPSRAEEVCDAIEPCLTYTHPLAGEAAVAAYVVWADKERALPVLTELAKHPSPSNSGPALKALAKLQGAGQIPQLIERILQGGDYSAAADALISIGPPAEDAVLNSLFSTGNLNRQLTACRILGQIGGEKTIAAFERRLAGRIEYNSLRESISETLYRMKPELRPADPTESLFADLQSPDKQSPVQITSSLNALAAVDRGGTYREQLNAQRLSAAIAPYFEHPDAGVREAAVRAVMVWGDGTQPRAVLLAILKSPHAAVRHAAIDALGAMKNIEDAPALMELVGDYPRVSKALTGMGSEVEGIVQSNWLDHEEWSLRSAACRILSDIGTEESVARLQAVARDDSNPIVRTGAEHAAKRLQERLAKQ